MKHPCSMIQDLLPLYRDEVCSPESRALVEEHLGTCEICEKKLRDLRQADQVDEKALAQAASAAWKQSKRRSVIKTIAVLLVAALLFSAVFAIPYTRWGMELTVRLWEAQLTDYAQRQLSESKPYHQHIQYEELMEYTVEICQEAGCVFFVYDGASRTGFFYSESGEPVGYQGHAYKFYPKGDGWYWRDPEYGILSSARMYAERITGNWYWFEMYD